MICNYHTHTYRCHHAEGVEREYIERAIANGIKKMGFSEHIPFKFPGDYRSYWRMDVEDAEEYIAAINELKREYRGEIELYVGFEMEYYPKYFKEMKTLALGWGAEYLILGEHYTGSEFPGGLYSAFENDDEERLVSYVDDSVAGIESGVFSIMAHPDLIGFCGDAEIYAREMRRICEASVRCGVPLEINLLGLRRGRHYPNRDFWRVAGEVGCTAVLGFDAHTPADAYDAESIPRGEALAAEFGVKIDEDPMLKLLK